MIYHRFYIRDGNWAFSALATSPLLPVWGHHHWTLQCLFPCNFHAHFGICHENSCGGWHDITSPTNIHFRRNKLLTDLSCNKCHVNASITQYAFLIQLLVIYVWLTLDEGGGSWGIHSSWCVCRVGQRAFKVRAQILSTSFNSDLSHQGTAPPRELDNTEHGTRIIYYYIILHLCKQICNGW